MDAIDYALVAAWRRISQRICDNPESADSKARLARMGARTLGRPPRAWCLCLRASDTRIHTKCWQISDEDRRTEIPLPAHHVWIDALHLRELMKPVDIDWPGVDWTEAARRLGRHPVSLRSWIAAGVFKVSRRNARSVGKIGNPVPFVHSGAKLDPEGL